MIDNRQYVLGKYRPYDFETITVSTVAIGLTAAKANPTTPKPIKALVTVETNRLRYRFDGTSPTASVGHVLTPGQSIVLEGYYQNNNFKAIRPDSADSTIQVSYLY